MALQTTPFRVYRDPAGKRYNTVAYVRGLGAKGAVSLRFTDLSEAQAAEITTALEKALPGLVPDNVG